MEQQLFLVHSFPRPETEQNGVDILALILSRGLLLVPEIIDFPDEHDDISCEVKNEGFTVLQQRLCFTIVGDDPTHLAKHGKRFGDFQIRFSLETARRKLGAIPAFYVANPYRKQPSFDKNGITLVHRLRGIQRILTNLKAIENMINESQEEFLPPIQNVEFKRQEMETLLKTIKGDTDATMNHYVRWVNFLSFFFVHTEYKGNPIDTDTLDEKHPYLEYYRQKEWRILGCIQCGDFEIDRDLKDEEKSELLALNEKFFSNHFTWKKEQRRVVDECSIIDVTIDGQHVRELIESIWVPKNLRPDDKSKVDEILKEYNMLDRLHTYQPIEDKTT